MNQIRYHYHHLSLHCYFESDITSRRNKATNKTNLLIHQSAILLLQSSNPLLHLLAVKSFIRLHLYQKAQEVCHTLMASLSELSFMTGQQEDRNHLVIPKSEVMRKKILNTVQAYLTLIARLVEVKPS